MIEIDPISYTVQFQPISSLWKLIQFQHYGEKVTLVYREMKLLLPGGEGVGGIITRGWGFRHGAKIFLPFDKTF